MAQNPADLKTVSMSFTEIEQHGYEEFNTVGRFLMFEKNQPESDNDLPKEVKFFHPPTHWSLRQLVNRHDPFPIEYKVWMMNGAIYRPDDLPAEIGYYKNGQLREMKWFNSKGHYHRLNGKPAIVRFTPDGLVDKCFWLANGHDCSEKIMDYCQEKGWDYLRLSKENIAQIADHFFTESNYF